MQTYIYESECINGVLYMERQHDLTRWALWTEEVIQCDTPRTYLEYSVQHSDAVFITVYAINVIINSLIDLFLLIYYVE